MLRNRVNPDKISSWRGANNPAVIREPKQHSTRAPKSRMNKKINTQSIREYPLPSSIKITGSPEDYLVYLYNTITSRRPVQWNKPMFGLTIAQHQQCIIDQAGLVIILGLITWNKPLVVWGKKIYQHPTKIVLKTQNVIDRFPLIQPWINPDTNQLVINGRHCTYAEHVTQHEWTKPAC